MKEKEAEGAAAGAGPAVAATGTVPKPPTSSAAVSIVGVASLTEVAVASIPSCTAFIFSINRPMFGSKTRVFSVAPQAAAAAAAANAGATLSSYTFFIPKAAAPATKVPTGFRSSAEDFSKGFAFFATIAA